MYTEIIAQVCVAWYIFIACVCTIGYVYLFIHYRCAPARAAVLRQAKADIPHVTVIRPCKGIEPYLYECLASTFLQDYPRDKITVHFCVSSRADSAYETIEAIVKDHPDHDARIFVEKEDDETAEQESYRTRLGPNPKIRNMSRAYREAKGDLIWIIDCNVWVGRGVCGRMVDRLCGFTTAANKKPATPYKLVHHLPISVDVDNYSIGRKRTDSSAYDETSPTALISQSTSRSTALTSINRYGGRLEELFLSSAHAKMYVAINMVAVAPCIVGKSNMFRRSHLDHLTSQRARLENPQDDYDPTPNTGIDYFSRNICEDHLIGDMLWKSKVPSSLPNFPRRMRNHGLVLGDLAIQPVSGMTVANYIARRVRWLRVRKFTVPTATLVEPGTESFLCSAYGAFGLTTCQSTRVTFGNTWTWFCLWWLVSITVWAAVDWTVYLLLHSGRTIEAAEDGADIPEFATPLDQSLFQARRPFKTWLYAWLGREALALPIWTWAIWGGASVTWRDRRFWVGFDMKVHEIREGHDSDNGISGLIKEANGRANGDAHVRGKKRTE